MSQEEIDYEGNEAEEPRIEMDSKTRKKYATKIEYIPMRLSEEERVLLAVLENALEVSEYTDVVDVTFSHTYKSKYSRIMESLVDLLSICSGLMISSNLPKGESLVCGKSLNDNIPFFKRMFEIGRRFKILNPHKMRNTYGKLIYIVMDCESAQVQNEVKASFLDPILTVSQFLKERSVNINSLLSEEALDIACRIVEAHYPAEKVPVDPSETAHGNKFIHKTPVEKTKDQIKAEVKRKQDAVAYLVKKYSSDLCSGDDLIRVIDSLADNHAYYAFNVKPVEEMIQHLTENFNKKSPSGKFSLDLSGAVAKSRQSSANSNYYGFSHLYEGFSMKFGGSRDGAMLSHDHSTQYTFVLQSLTLWYEIMKNMPLMWYLADLDMLKQPYRLCDTGQGYQRVQSCPQVSQVMSHMLRLVKNKVEDSWVGLSVVHLGDRDVPNALVFIDKYTQIPRILTPIVHCLFTIERLPSLVEQHDSVNVNQCLLNSYIKAEWGSVDAVKMQILTDFFKHGFDGSGDDGGSCIDGRLTSAWNWCSKIQKKPFYYIFLYTGFQGFDGDWKN